jgi:integrase
MLVACVPRCYPGISPTWTTASRSVAKGGEMSVKGAGDHSPAMRSKATLIADAPALRWVPVHRYTSPDRRVFQGATPNALRNVVTRACKAAGIAHRSPHDLRHRYASVKIAEGVPVTVLAAQLGHSRKSLTLDTYAHVVIDELGR